MRTRRRPNESPRPGDVSRVKPCKKSPVLSDKLTQSVAGRHKFGLTAFIALFAVFLVCIIPYIFNFGTSSVKSSIETAPGGWRQASRETLLQYDTARCAVERISVLDLTPERFESEFRFQKSVIVTFPDGARSWTDPDKWSRASLVNAYSEWSISSGQSLDIVRKGGNADRDSSFLTFVEELMDRNETDTREPLHYAFDRNFWGNSDLPGTLKLPEYFHVDKSQDDSIFFLGASLSGIAFHKHSDTWNGVVYGRKRWFLYPSDRTPPGGIYHGYSLLDWVNTVYPNLTEENRPMECVHEAGEILYLSEGTYHATLNLGDTVAVALQKKEATLKAELLSYEATDLNQVIQAQSDLDPECAYYQRMLEIYQELHQLLPENSEAVMNIGYYLLLKERGKESILWLKQAIDMDPYFVLAYLHLGSAFTLVMKYEYAEAVFLKAISLSPRLWDCYKEYGEFLLKMGRPVDALPIFKRGTELKPDMLAFWFYYKLCQTETGDLEGAELSEQRMVH